MRNVLITWFIPAVVALAGLVALEFWLTYDPVPQLVMRVPGLDGAPVIGAQVDLVDIGRYFQAGAGLPADIPGKWPQFRGSDRDNILVDQVPLADAWGDGQPPVLWRIELGEGHAGAAIRDGRVYLLDYDEEAGRDTLRCLSLDDGREIWRRAYDVEVRRNHGMSRTVPAVSERYVVTLGPRGHVMCVDAATGEYGWGIDLVREYGTQIPMWYTGQCPLIVDDVAIIVPAGTEVLMMGVDCADGTILWQTPNIHGLAMSHSSVMPAAFDGVPMLVYAALGGMVGVEAGGADAGRLHWYAPQWDRSVMAPSPVIVPDGRIFVTAGYGGGSMMLSVVRAAAGFEVHTLDVFDAAHGLASEQQTPLLYDGHMFGILPNDAGALRNQLVCVNFDDPRTFVWTSGRENRFGLGPYIIADGKLYVLSDDGVLTMLRATAGGYRELGRRRLFDGHDAWAPLALASGRLVLRDDTRMLCVDLR